MNPPVSSKKLFWLDRLLFKILRMEPLPLKEKNEVPVKVGTVFRLYHESQSKFPLATALTIISCIGASFLAVLGPYIFKQFLDLLSVGPAAADMQKIQEMIFWFFAVSILTWGFWRTAYFTNSYLAANMLADLRQRAFSYLLKHSHQFFLNTFAGSLVQKVNRFAQSYDRLADRFWYDIIPVIVQASVILYILSKEQAILAVVLFVWAFVFIVWNYAFARWKLKYDTSRASQDTLSSATLADAVGNHQTIELYRSQEIEEGLYEDVTNLQSRYARFSWQSSTIIDGVQALLIVLVEVAILYVGVRLWSQGLMTIGLFVLVQTYVLQLAEKLWSLSRVVRDVYESFADAQEMARIMTTPHAIEDPVLPKKLHDVVGEVTFKDVTFAFRDRVVIDHLNVTIAPGEKVALVGASGAGKSTLVKLLFRQYDPNQGEVQIDGKNIKEVKLATLRSALSLVPQDPALFHRTLRENIRYGKPDATDEEVEEAARLAHCDDFIKNLSHGYDTLVGERGVKLSGGERQRVAIARAFLRNSPILVLDEATSSLDSHSEERIQDSLMRLMEGRTTIIIAHRLSTIRRVDRILVMKEGKVVEDGTHDELLKKKNGVYAKLWTIQQGGFLKDEDVEKE